MPARRRVSLLTTAGDAVTLSFMGNPGKAPDLRRGGVSGCLGRLYRHVYRLHQFVREGRQHFDVLSCVVYRMFHRLLQKIRLDRRSLFHAMRFAKLFDVPIRADKRLPGHLRDLASESLDGFDCRGHSLDRDIVGGAFNASVGGFLFSHYFPPNSLIYDRIQYKMCHNILPMSVAYATRKQIKLDNPELLRQDRRCGYRATGPKRVA